MLIIDPMHNLFLGSAKYFMRNILITKGLLSDANLCKIQDKINAFVVPSDIGRIPIKIQSGFSSFISDQWKNWSIYFSIVVLHDVLEQEVLECWRHFVLACRILCARHITLERVKLGDALLLQFYRRVERMFGKGCITPNMHLHCHLADCIIDYGPLHNFWCYPFERYNGILGSLPNSNRSIESQLMQRFLSENEILSCSFPDEFSDSFLPCFPKMRQTGSVC